MTGYGLYFGGKSKILSSGVLRFVYCYVASILYIFLFLLWMSECTNDSYTFTLLGVSG